MVEENKIFFAGHGIKSQAGEELVQRRTSAHLPPKPMDREKVLPGLVITLFGSAKRGAAAKRHRQLTEFIESGLQVHAEQA